LDTAIAIPIPRYTLEMNIIIDTDVGYDDLLAILYLMNCPNITIEAFTVVNGISTVTDGSNALLSLQEMLGTKPAIPVYLGADASQQANALPVEYQGEAKALNWALPTRLKAETQSASDYLTAQFTKADTTVLAIGPLTNLAVALPSGNTANVITVYAMGGAFKVKGDLPTPTYPSDVEANFYVDPAAAAKVLANATRSYLVPLDACDQVPITTDDIANFLNLPSSQQKPNFKYAKQILEEDDITKWAQDNEYYAWDELAAMALNWNNVLSDQEQSGVVVEQVGSGNMSPGKTTITNGWTAIFYSANGPQFNSDFLAAFSK
jgi:inosine-uridine nucleoside N-ribohydrolase